MKLSRTLVTLVAAALLATSVEASTDGAKAGGLIDRSSRPKRIDAAECVNTGAAACLVTVKVGANCAVTLSPEALFIRRKGAGAIVWRIDTAGWSFAERDGIKFKGDAKEFDAGERVAPRIWKVRNKGEYLGVWRYGVTVVDGKGKPCVVDPEVVTDWG